VEPVFVCDEMLGDLVLSFGNELGGGRRRGSAEVGGKVGDGEIGFVTDGGDDGELAGCNGAGYALAVESGQIFERSAAAGEDDDVDERRAVLGGVVEMIDCRFDFGGGLIALDRDGDKDDAEA
jgi:hypothetical protein